MGARRATLLVAATVGGAALMARPATKPETVRVPAQDAGADSLASRKAAQEKTLARSPVDSRFRFADRLAESGITFVHRITDDSGKNYKPNHYDHGNGLAAADVDGDGRPDLYFVNQLGGNELWRNLGGRQVPRRHGRRGRGSAGPDQRLGLLRRHRQRRRRGPLRDDRPQGQRAVRERREGAVPRRLEGVGRWATPATPPGAVFFDYDRDGLLDLFLVNVGKYTTDEKGPGRLLRRLRGRVPAATSSRAHRAQHPLPQPGKQPVPRTSTERDGPACSDGWSGDASFADFNERRLPDLYVLNMQGDDHYYENVQGKTLRRQERPPSSPRPPGAPWASSSSTTTTTATWTSSSPTCTRT